jgi:carbon storage regulator CsrA
MLVLSRKLNEKVTIRDPESSEDVVVLTVVSIDGGKVRLGFDTPAAFLEVVRNELLEREEAYVARTPLPR